MKQESSKEAVDSIFFFLGLGLACILPLRVGSFFPSETLAKIKFLFACCYLFKGAYG